jgi:hypothetical protein
MTSFRSALLAFALLAAVSVQPAMADDAPWPSDLESRLAVVDTQVLDTQRKLFAARQTGDAQEVERLSKKFKTLREEHVKLLRATNQMP